MADMLHTVFIACYPYKDSVVVSASNSGQEKHPVGYFNMKARSQVTVQLGKACYRATAEDVPQKNRAAL